MSLESEDQFPLATVVESKDESQKRLRISYTREFLLSLSDLDICKRLPAGFSASTLSEFEDASHSIPERQRVPGASLLRHASTPHSRVDSSSNYSRGSHGRWDTRSSGSNDKDGDSLSDRDQDSGRRNGNHSRRSWQLPEHDGLLGSGAFPRPSGYTGSASAPRVRGNDNFQLNRSNEPYHPPRFYKAPPHSRQEATDLRNDETFGSTECSSEDRAEEERKRRASFELMRKEQQKALQEKQKHSDKHKELLDNDIVALLKNSGDEKNLWNKSDDKLENHVQPASVSQVDSVKSSVPTQAPASRPLVPPGFASSILEKNLGAKSMLPTPRPEVGNIGFEDSAHSKLNGSGDNQNNEKHSAACIQPHEQKCETWNLGVPFMDANENDLVLSSGAEASNSLSFENSYYKSSSLLEAREGWVDTSVAISEAEKVTKFEVGTDGQDQSTSLLDKLFSNALAVEGVGSPSSVEHNHVKSDGVTLSAKSSSKFARWFLEEEKKPVDDVSSSKSRDLLSLIVSHDNGGPQVSKVSIEKAFENILSIFPFENNEAAQKLMTSNAITSTAAIVEPLYHCDKPDAQSGVLTCEDLEQSILAEVKDSGSSLLQHARQGAWDSMDAKVEAKKADVDDHASQHLLSLLQKGTSSKMPTPSTFNLEMGSSDKLGIPGNMISATQNVQNTEKTLTLETLFGTAFMKELHSVEAPVSAHRVSASGAARSDVPEPHGLPCSIADDGFFLPSGSELVSNKPNLVQVPQPEKIEGHWLSFNDPRSKSLKLESDGSFEGRADRVFDVRLPAEESLIAVGDPLHNETSQFMPVGNVARMSSEPLVEIVDKLAALNTTLKDERTTVPGLGGPAVPRSPYEPLESAVTYKHLHGRPPQFAPHQMNNARPPFNPLDQHAFRNSEMKFIAPEGIHHDPQHAFPPNFVPPSFHGLGGPRFNPVHSALQQMPMPENFPPHLLHGMPRGMPVSHPFNNMPGYLPEVNPIQGFPLNHQQANYSGHGIGIPGSGVGAGNHPEMLERLIEMELRGNQKQTPPVAAGHGPGIYGRELDMAFRYR